MYIDTSSPTDRTTHRSGDCILGQFDPPSSERRIIRNIIAEIAVDLRKRKNEIATI
ncbi:MAG: hypothetical protein IT360_10495 [Gemmatimonadaceae bacterium]|nr:hypothetical protein [Gemmatimonadaceae bacterium]